MSKKLAKQALRWCVDAISNEIAYVLKENPSDLSEKDLDTLTDYMAQIADTFVLGFDFKEKDK